MNFRGWLSRPRAPDPLRLIFSCIRTTWTRSSTARSARAAAWRCLWVHSVHTGGIESENLPLDVVGERFPPEALHQILGHLQPAEGFDLPLRRAPPDRVCAPQNVVDSKRVNDHSHYVRGEHRARGHHVGERAAHFHVDVVDLRILLFPRAKV